MKLVQVASFSARTHKELEAFINGFIAETRADVKDISFFTTIDGWFGAYLVYYAN